MRLDPDVCYRALRTRDARFDGRIFVAVRTTGIYCRPICPARTPKRENVEFHPSAASAQAAGFRPCLRCRPEASPDLGAWRGTSSTVSRALALIAGGALDGDDADVGGLASRLGIGERQLRRLFLQHLGASPIAVAQTRRVLFAKQLIHETRMSMTAIAAAAGFGSLRRFHATFRGLYGRPPSSLRRRASVGAGDDRVAPITLQLGYVPPYDWEAMVAFLAGRAIAGVEVVEPGRYRRTIGIDQVYGTIEVAPLAGRAALAVTIRFPDLRALPAIVARVRRVFDLGVDVDAVNAELAADPVLARLVAARPGLRVPGAWDGFELAVRAVLGQQVTVRAARGLAARLVTAHGIALPPAVENADGLTTVFPTAEGLADAALAPLGMPRARAATLSALARAAAADPRLFERGRDLEETVARLRALPGIGDWTAHYVAMRAMREPDAFPASDVGLLRALAAGGVRPTPMALAARAEAWRPWRAYAAQHLWTADAVRTVGVAGAREEAVA
jgi:AraC family transcriptional regulator of adaptative response / DNA-3-methyladenine glycosylase II